MKRASRRPIPTPLSADAKTGWVATNLVCYLLFSVPTFFQKPEIPAELGQLVVKSNPAGAVIRIDNSIMKQKTDASFLVSPGRHLVSVSGNPNCAGIYVRVNSGEVKELNCPGAWK